MTKFASDNIEYIIKFLKIKSYDKIWSDDWIINNIYDYIDCNKKEYFKVEIYHTKKSLKESIDFTYPVDYRFFTIKTVTYNDINQLKRRDKLKKIKNLLIYD